MDSGKVLSDTLVSVSRRFLFILRGIILIPIITKTAGTDVYGLWSTAIALAGVLVIVGGFHMHGALIRFGQREDDIQTSVSEVYILTLLTTSVVATTYVLVEFVFGLGLVGGGIENGFRGTLLLAGLTIAWGGFVVLQNTPRASGNVKIYEFIEIVRGFLEAVVLGVVFFLTGRVFAGLLALCSLYVLLNLILGIKYLTRVGIPARSSFKRYFSYGAPMFPKEVASSLIQHGDKILILYFMSPTAVGIYAVTYSVTKLLQTMAGTMNSTLYPTVSSLWDNDDHDSLVKLYNQINRWIVLLGIPALVGLIFVANPAIRLLSTPKIATTSVDFIPILAVGFAISGYSKPLVYILTAAEETVKLGGINIFAATLNIVLNILLIPWAGLIGAALATATSQVVTAGYITYYARGRLDFSFPARSFVISIIGTTLMLGGLILIPLPPSAVIQTVVYPVVGILIYFPLIIILGGTSWSELTSVIQTDRF
jgi:O-antigen/teichoic acid export membrane protein